jgi:hypothetical protein
MKILELKSCKLCPYIAKTAFLCCLEEKYRNLQAVNESLNKENRRMYKMIISLEKEIKRIKENK